MSEELKARIAELERQNSLLVEALERIANGVTGDMRLRLTDLPMAAIARLALATVKLAAAFRLLIADLEEVESNFNECVGGFKRDLQKKLADQRRKNNRLTAELTTMRKQLAEAQACNAQVLSVAEKMRCAGGAQEFQHWFDELKLFLLRKPDTSALDASIAEAVERYRKDAERLDWLERVCKETPLNQKAFSSEIAPDTRLRFDFPTLVSYDAIGQKISLRDAIGAAIEAMGKQI